MQCLSGFEPYSRWVPLNSLLNLGVKESRFALCVLYSFFLGKSAQAGKGAMRLILCEAPTRETRPDHYTGNSVPYSLRQVRGFFNVPCWLYNTEDAGDGAYDLSSLSEKTRTSNHLQMSLQRQHVLLSYFKTLSVGSVWDSNLRPPAQQSGACTNWANWSAVNKLSADVLICFQWTWIELTL